MSAIATLPRMFGGKEKGARTHYASILLKYFLKVDSKTKFVSALLMIEQQLMDQTHLT
jgi:hypothetical protein